MVKAGSHAAIAREDRSDRVARLNTRPSISYAFSPTPHSSIPPPANQAGYIAKHSGAHGHLHINRHSVAAAHTRLARWVNQRQAELSGRCLVFRQQPTLDAPHL